MQQSHLSLSKAKIHHYRFVCATTLYCVIGCIAKSCMGSRGADVIPNNEMWSNLPGYTQVCIHCISLITS